MPLKSLVSAATAYIELYDQNPERVDTISLELIRLSAERVLRIDPENPLARAAVAIVHGQALLRVEDLRRALSRTTSSSGVHPDVAAEVKAHLTSLRANPVEPDPQPSRYADQPFLGAAEYQRRLGRHLLHLAGVVEELLAALADMASVQSDHALAAAKRRRVSEAMATLESLGVRAPATYDDAQRPLDVRHVAVTPRGLEIGGVSRVTRADCPKCGRTDLRVRGGVLETHSRTDVCDQKTP